MIKFQESWLDSKKNTNLKEIEAILKFVGEIQKIYGKHVKSIILYGSYARQDYQEDSDIDIMVLVDFPEDEIRKYRDKVSDAAYNINYDNNVLLMPIVQNVEHFNKWVRAYPFYNNISNEGVELYAS